MSLFDCIVAAPPDRYAKRKVLPPSTVVFKWPGSRDPCNFSNSRPRIATTRGSAAKIALVIEAPRRRS
jgi:hypothetical protein